MNKQSLRATILNKIHGYQVTQAISVAVRLGIPFHLGNKDYEELAELTNSHPESMLRLLRVLLNEGIVSKDSSGKFQLTNLGKLLRKEDEDSVYGLALIHGTNASWGYWEKLFNFIHSPSANNNQQNLNQYESNTSKEDQNIYIEALQYLESQEASWLIKQYDFSIFKTVADIGGGQGSLLLSILKKHHNIKGIMHGNFNHPTQLDYHTTNRCKNIQGDFLTDNFTFKTDSCILRHIIHNLHDQIAISLLNRCKNSLNLSGKIILIEIIKNNDLDNNNFSALRDLHTALSMRGGIERTKYDYKHLAERAGLKNTNFISLTSSLNVIELSV